MKLVLNDEYKDYEELVNQLQSDLPGLRNLSMVYDTTTYTMTLVYGSGYLPGGEYFNDYEVVISVDNNGYLDKFSTSGYVGGKYVRISGLHHFSYSERDELESLISPLFKFGQSVEAAYDRIGTREWAEEQAFIPGDVADKAVETAEALITQEKNELRNTFDANYYLERYTDVKEAYGSDAELALDHYVRYGKQEGRSHINEAEVQRLIEAAEAQKALEEAEALITQEKNELRNTFDAEYYLERYSDVKEAYGSDAELALDHYVRSGKNEGRSHVNEAEVQRLIEEAAAQKALEVAEALITQEKNELRNSFDANYYLERYSDVKEAYGSDVELALDHYVRNGKNEGRSFLNTRPTAITLDNSSVPENSSGSHIGNLSGVDPENDALTFNIVGGSDASMFEIVNNMLHLSTNATADYETKSNLYVELSTTDIGGLSYNQSFTIFVTNTDESQLISYGGLGRDTFSGFSGYKTINGKEEIDIVQYSYSSNGITFSAGVDDELVVMSADGKRESLSLIERLQFTDKVYALGIDSNAGIAAKVIISAFGAENLSSYMSSILSVVDGGKTIESLSDYVIDSGLIDSVIGSATNGSFVEHIFENVVGRLPNLVEQTIYTDYLDNGTYTKSSLLALAANTTLTEALVTANSVDLIGVAGSADGEILALQYDLGLG